MGCGCKKTTRIGSGVVPPKVEVTPKQNSVKPTVTVKKS